MPPLLIGQGQVKRDDWVPRLTCGIDNGIQERPEGRRGTVWQEVCEEEPVAEVAGRGSGARPLELHLFPFHFH